MKCSGSVLNVVSLNVRFCKFNYQVSLIIVKGSYGDLDIFLGNILITLFERK